MHDEASGGFWDRTGWGIFTGAVTAAGLVGAQAEVGTLGCLVVFVFLEVGVGVPGWLWLAQLGKPGALAVVELAPAFTLAALTVMGWALSWGLWTLPVLTAVVLTSPFLKASVRREVARHYGSDQAAVRRQFDEIVARSLADPGASSGTGEPV